MGEGWAAKAFGNEYIRIIVPLLFTANSISDSHLNP